jgi:hypothetical protein
MRTLNRATSTLLPVLTLILLLVAFVQPARADAYLDFGVVAPTTGSISFAGTGNPLVGADISVDNVVGTGGTTLNNDVTLDITGGLLNFTTGNYQGESGGNYVFGGGGSITITGGIAALGIANGTTLLSGTFDTVQVVVNGPTAKIVSASFSDEKDEDLAAYFGFSNVPGWIGFSNIGFSASGAPPSGFTSTSVTSGDMTDYPVPEPASLLLLGSGLIGIGVLARRRLK